MGPVLLQISAGTAVTFGIAPAANRTHRIMDDTLLGIIAIFGGVALSAFVWHELARGECLK